MGIVCLVVHRLGRRRRLRLSLSRLAFLTSVTVTVISFLFHRIERNDVRIGT